MQANVLLNELNEIVDKICRSGQQARKVLFETGCVHKCIWVQW